MSKKMTKEHRTVLLRGIFAGILILAAAFGKLLVRHDPYQVNMRAAFQKPGGEYLFGTENLGRCVFCRIVTGSRTSLFSALLVILIVFVVGTLIGAAAGYMGGLADEILMKTALIFQAFPAFILAVAVAGILGVGLRNSILALCAVYWATYAKLARSLVVTMKNENFIYAARLNGAPGYVVVFRYIFPNIVGTMSVAAAADVGSVILNMAGLSFLGLGAVRPTAEWGAVMGEADKYLQNAPWIIGFNGAALFVVVVVFQLLGDSIRDIMDASDKRKYT